MQIECHRVDYDQLSDIDRSQSLPQQAFLQLLAGDQDIQGDLIDIGAGLGPNRFLQQTFGDRSPVDGVDVDEQVLQNQQLRKAWHCPFETADIVDQAYAFAIAVNVLEHIEQAEPFFRQLARVLEPGGVFWAYTPYAYHPFPLLSRGIEVVGLKGLFARSNDNVNDYPAYYRLNSVRAIERATEGLPFVSAKFYLMYAPNWKNYFPGPSKVVPALYDAVTRHRSAGVVAFRLEKADA